MYEELVKRLRDAAKMSDALAVLLPRSEGNATAKLFNEAADAIEELIAWHNADVRELGRQKILIADMRPVVLCRDCDMYECHEYDGGLKYVCRLFKRQMQEADFCSYGKKREES